VPEATTAGTVQLKNKGVDEYTLDVSIEKVTVADEPVPEYTVVTLENNVPWVVIVPIVLTNEQLENEQDVLGKLKY